MEYKTRRAFAKYGKDNCERAWTMCYVEGFGASGISLEGPITIRTTRQADAAINAWEDNRFNAAKILLETYPAPVVDT